MHSEVSSNRPQVSQESGGGDGQRVGGLEGPRDVKRGVAIAVGASAILHVSVMLALDAVEPPRERERKLLKVSVIDWKPARAAAVEYEPIEVAVVRLTEATASCAPRPISRCAPTPRSGWRT